MNRVLKIVIYAVVLFLIYLWVASVVKSCNNRPAKRNETSISSESQDTSLDVEIYDEFFEVDPEEETTSADNPDYEDIDLSETKTEISDNDFSFVQTEQEKKQRESRPEPATTSTAKPALAPSSDSGNFLVIAGSYLIKENAAKMVDKLKNLGFYDAEIVTFDLSQYHSVSAGRYQTYDQASQTAREVKNKGIDCYVHTRKQ